MTVLVTGGAGFVGSNFVLDWLAQSDETIVNLDKITYAGNLENLSSLDGDSRHQFVQGDIADSALVSRLFSKYLPRAILNFAAESHVDRSISGPESFIQTNIIGTFTLLEAARGFFFESFNHKKFDEAIGRKVEFVQDNHSKSSKGVLRGLHYQLPPYAQGKLVRVVQGEVFDVAVDIRKSSPTFGQWVAETLSADNKKQLWIPEGFAHGFLTLSETADLVYKLTDYYSKKKQKNIFYNDQFLNIYWPLKELYILSDKDKKISEEWRLKDDF